jgi:hypothetical protein
MQAPHSGVCVCRFAPAAALALVAFAAGALFGPRAGAAAPSRAPAAVACAAFAVLWVLKPARAEDHERATTLPAGWVAFGGTGVSAGGALATAPGVVACRSVG